MIEKKIYRINYKSDFILTLESDAGWLTPFCIKFWTGAPSMAYFVGWDGTSYTHCSYDPSEPTKLQVQFDDHNLPVGDLKFQISYHFTAADFPNDTEDEVINAASISTIIDGETYQVMLDFNGETAPEIQFSLPAYANEVARIENELQRQENELQRQENELAREQASAAAVAGAENVNAQLSGTILTVTNRNGVSTSSNVQGPQGEQGEQGEPGSDADVTAENIASALGYTPQEALVSGTNIKTINNQSLLGSGNIDIQGGGGGAVESVNGKTGVVVLTASDVGAYVKPSGGIPKTDLASGVQTSLGKADSAYQKPSSGIPSTDLASGVQTSLGKADSAYQKPSGGIPSSDLASAVQTSLGKADTAVQPAAIANLESKMAIVAASGTTLTASVDNYYLFGSEVGTLAITLTTPSDTTHITKAVFMLTTGSTPAVTFAGASGINVIAQDDFSIEASTTYEINAIFNGVAWVVACMKLSTTPINS